VHLRDRSETPGVCCLDDEVRSNLVFPIISNNGPVGAFDFGSREAHAFEPEDIDICAMLVDQMAYSIENIRLLGELSESRDAVIRGMALLAESRDNNIGGHLDRICASARMVAGRLLGLPEYQDEVSVEFVETIARAAALHDIGKVGIPDAILLKPGRLTEAEFEVMKTHTTLGQELLAHLMDQHGSYYMIQMGAEVALSHHEWWDGNGYPNGWRGDRTPLSARIVALADVYDALTSKRIYKDAWCHEDALADIRAKAGIQFDPALTEIFLSNPEELLEIRQAYPD
jgi:response regulator RpfG family c-di-GMP phosphodiesterase